MVQGLGSQEKPSGIGPELTNGPLRGTVLQVRIIRRRGSGAMQRPLFLRRTVIHTAYSGIFIHLFIQFTYWDALWKSYAA